MIKFLLIIFLVAVGLLLSSRNKNGIRSNIYLLLLSTSFCLLLGEFLCMKFNVHSDGLSISISAQTWKEKYWHPINSHGYRDQDWSSIGVNDKIITFIGDSFTAGIGINNVVDRFADMTSLLLSAPWRSVVIAKPGFGTDSEYYSLNEFPKFSDVIVLGYVFNDIEDSFRGCGRDTKFPLNNKICSNALFLSSISHLANFILTPLNFGNYCGLGSYYMKMIKEGFNDPECRAVHLEQVAKLISLAKLKSNKVIFVIFPQYGSIKESKEIVELIKDNVAAYNVDLIDGSNGFESYTPDKLIVNRTDSHPSLFVHKTIACIIAKKINNAINC